MFETGKYRKIFFVKGKREHNFRMKFWDLEPDFSMQFRIQFDHLASKIFTKTPTIHPQLASILRRYFSPKVANDKSQSERFSRSEFTTNTDHQEQKFPRERQSKKHPLFRAKNIPKKNRKNITIKKLPAKQKNRLKKSFHLVYLIGKIAPKI
ncbi:MAG TPA: hypothetical protein VEV16_04020 [Daejeonella sp.]|nr:hypothetical protein [Daejeonella sp.]